MSGELKHRIEWEPAYDRMNEGKGVHGVTMRWYVQGDAGAVQFVVYTNWMLSDIHDGAEEWQTIIRRTDHVMCAPLPADLGYHSPTPRYEGQTRMEHCDLLPDGCFYDGSSLNANRIFALLVREGGDAVWNALDTYYADTLLTEAVVS